MNIFLILGILLFLIILFFLFKPLIRKTKLSLFDRKTDHPELLLEKNLNMEKYSSKQTASKEQTTSIKQTKPKDDLKRKSEKDSANNGEVKKIESKITSKSSSGLKITSFKEIYHALEGSELSDLIHYFEINNISLVTEKDLEKEIISSGGVEAFIKSKIIAFLNSQYGDLRDRISALRKNGKDMKEAQLILLIIPLKIKVFSATFKKKDFDSVIQRIGSIKEMLKNFN